ncbi:MAG: leucine--tRNA ligase [Saprospiraceae bacterium]|nr:leucine--tRNA ligase [Saprospiraceae bacterium]
MDYQPGEIEEIWRKYWVENEVYKTLNDSSKPKYYVLDMFPYPSGAGLHVGHPLGYIASDIFARYKRLQGYNVLHPMGYDAFGLPAEQYAIQTGVHPSVSTNQNINFYRKQLDNLGFSFDWDRTVNTSDPKYYKWTQAIFLKLFGHYYNNSTNKAESIDDLILVFQNEGNINVHAANTQDTVFSANEWMNFSPAQKDEILMNYRLAYRKVGFVNWCEELGTVLANDEVKDGLSERGGYPVVKKPMRQWALRITAYAERLLQGLDSVDFSEALKTQQRNWIGKSEGAKIFFKLKDDEDVIEVFTTRPDTVFGVTFMVLAPEHELVSQITTTEQKEDVESYLAYSGSRSERDRMADVKSVTGAFTGAYAINPFNGESIPVWIADYVLIGYGTGAIMAVPGGDERDERFARHFGIDIIQVVDQSAYKGASISDKVGEMINSDFLNGMVVTEAIKMAISKIEALKIGQGKVNYRLRDANFSRQRYWGEPFPIKYDKDGVSFAETDLPLELPLLNNYKPTSDGKAPLARAADWCNDGLYTREIDTMPGFAGSSWYFLRYMDPHNNSEPFSKESVNYWKDVDLYVGGAEHAVGHLMYSRFWHKFMYDLGMVPTREPYKKLVNQGMLQGVIEFLYLLKEKQGGKSVFVSADELNNYDGEEFAHIPVHIDYVTDYGTENSYLNSEGIEQFKKWRPDYDNALFITNKNGQLITKSEIGKISKRYFNVVNPDDVIREYGTDCFRMYEMFLGPLKDSKPWDTKGIVGVSKFLRKFWSLFYDQDKKWLLTDNNPSGEELKILHTAIKKVNQDIENFSFNTCVAHFMVATNELKKIKCAKINVLKPLIILMAPFAPFITEQLWHDMGEMGSVHNYSNYPEHDEKYLVEDTIDYPVCINGKKRAIATFEINATKQVIEEYALGLEEIKKWIDGRPVRKVIIVPKRMVNIVI